MKMQQDVLHLEQELWSPHYNEKHYEGEWNILPLRSLNGSIENNISIHSSALQKGDNYMDTVLLNKCTYLENVISFFECEKLSARLMNLKPGAFIKEHRDHDMSYEEGEARFHIPIFTNRLVDFYIEEEKIPMQQGECWYLNLSLKHRVSNFGTTERVHLVIDCKVNNWVKTLLNNEALLKVEMDDRQKEALYSADDRIRIIQQLRLLATPVSIELADKMEKENRQ